MRTLQNESPGRRDFSLVIRKASSRRAILVMPRDAADMPVIRAAAAANHTNVRKQFQESCAQLAKLRRIAVIRKRFADPLLPR